jgi:hypothetical protein
MPELSTGRRAPRRACPPEDCGGPDGYARLLDVLAEPRHPEHGDAAEWLGRPIDPERFEPEEATWRMRTRRAG